MEDGCLTSIGAIFIICFAIIVITEAKGCGDFGVFIALIIFIGFIISLLKAN